MTRKYPRPGKPRALSIDQAAEARRRYVHAKTSPSSLASEFGVSYGTMLAVLMCTGTYANDGEPVKVRAVRYHGNQKLSDEQVREIRRLRSEGASFEALAEKFSVSTSTALYAVNRGLRFAHVDPLDEAPDAVTALSDGERKALLVAKVENMMLAGRSAAEIVDFVHIYG